MKKELLTKPFPREMIRQRQGAHGQTLNYVEAHAVIARLNEAADHEWSFEITRHDVLADEVIVLGKLTIDGVTKMAFGGSSVTRDNAGKEVSLADDLKAAASDCTKKCASLFGIGLEMYGASAPVQSNGRGGPPESIDKITQRQLQAIHAHARRRGIALPELGAMLLERTGKGEPQSLTRREASGVLDVLSSANGTHR